MVLGVSPSMLRPPLALVVPAPLMVPPLKVVSPLTLRMPLPPNCPALRVKLAAVTTSWAASPMLTIPPETWVTPVPLKLTPSWMVWVVDAAAPVKLRTPGVVAVKVPELTPPPFSLSVPACTVTRPLLLKTASIWVTPVPADLEKLPELLRVPPPVEMKMGWSFWASKLPLLLKTPPPRICRYPAPVQVALAELWRV